MKVTITDKALKEIRSVAERQKVKDVALYLDIAKTCCSVVPFVKVIERPDAGSDPIINLGGIAICSCDFVKKILADHEDVRAEIDLSKLFGFDELTIRFYRDAI